MPKPVKAIALAASPQVMIRVQLSDLLPPARIASSDFWML